MGITACPLVSFYQWLQTRTHAENEAEAAARANDPVTLPALMGGGAGLAYQSDTDIARAIDILKGYLTEDRLARMQDVLDQRTRSASVVFENPANPNNVSRVYLILRRDGRQKRMTFLDY